ncbi:EamA family transporter RarD [Thermodesulfobacteriota bacterium]
MTSPSNPDTSRSESLLGVIYAGAAFLIWGLAAVYWKELKSVPPLEIIAHRVAWSFLFLLPLILLQRQWAEFVAILKNLRMVLILLTSAILVAANWLIYVWAVNNDHLLQASLGYYINPLVNVVLGMVFLKERLRPPQVIAVLLAAAGVLYLTVQYGRFPWIAISLAMSFGLYGLIRKMAPVSSLVGLAVETLLLSLPAIGYLFYLDFQGTGSIFRVSFNLDLLLIGCAPLTAIPLLFFTAGAKRLYLSTVGLMQYIGPSGMFLLAVFYYHEPFSTAQVWTFVMIWSALAIYSTDSVIYFRRQK